MKKVITGFALLLVLCVGAQPAPAWNLGTLRLQPLIMLDKGDSWEYDRFAIAQVRTGELFLEVPHVENGETLAAVYLMWQGAPGHTSNPVGNGIDVPWLEVYAIDAYGVEYKLCWGQDDPLQTPAQYESPHVIVADDCDLEHVQSRERIGARVLGEFTTGWYEEGEADFLPGGRVLSLRTVTN